MVNLGEVAVWTDCVCGVGVYRDPQVDLQFLKEISN